MLHPLQAADLLVERAVSIQQQALPDLKPPADVEYARLRLQLEYISHAATAGMPAAANLFSDKTLEKLAPGSAALRNLDSRLRQLERALYGGERPALQPEPAPELAAAVASLALFEIERLQASLMRKAQQVFGSCMFILLTVLLAWCRLSLGVKACVHAGLQVQLMEQLIPHLATRRSEQSKLRRAKQALKLKVEPELNSLLRWLGGGYTGFDLLPAELQRRGTAAAESDQWSAGRLGWGGGLSMKVGEGGEWVRTTQATAAHAHHALAAHSGHATFSMLQMTSAAVCTHGSAMMLPSLAPQLLPLGISSSPSCASTQAR